MLLIVRAISGRFITAAPSAAGLIARCEALLNQRKEYTLKFHDIIKSAALEFARKNATVVPGEIVETNWGWKKPHKVMISHVGAALACGDFNREVWEFHAELVMTYYAFKLDKNGEPKTEPGGCIVLSTFTKADGTEWQMAKNTINNATVHWHLPESWRWDNDSSKYVKGAESV
jgi:hypothetical protein